MSFCVQCGANLGTNFKFCTKCGKKINFDSQQQEINHKNRDEKILLLALVKLLGI